MPSYNVNQQPIGDAATLVRPANLRGLPPDSTLILVNGKRRHRSSVISLLGGGISDGAHAADLAAIPAIALKRVEVLRDGAAAQYGSGRHRRRDEFHVERRPRQRHGGSPLGSVLCRRRRLPQYRGQLGRAPAPPVHPIPGLPTSVSNTEHPTRPTVVSNAPMRRH